jgi:multiple sugar transport system substrate-binding protein
MLATAAQYESAHGGSISIEWVPRTLKEFGMVSVEELAQTFDLIVMDHPHVGTMATSGSVVALDDHLSASQMELLARRSPGRSHESYQFAGHQWALAIDAACQTSAWRADLLEAPPVTWEQVLDLARQGRVLWPLCGVDAAASLLTLAASKGSPCATRNDRFVDRGVALWAIETMREVAGTSNSRCLDDNPIQALEALARSNDYVYSPLLFCYMNYSRVGHEGAKVSFGDIPTVEEGGSPTGSLLGGAGLAVSAFSDSIREAVEYSAYVASSAVQRGAYFDSGGQPAHHDAWSDPELDRVSGGFFSGVGPTIEGSWTRPNGPYFAPFQNNVIELFDDWFEATSDANLFLDRLDDLYRSSISSSGILA